MSAASADCANGLSQGHPTHAFSKEKDKDRRALIRAPILIFVMGAVWAVVCGRLSPCGFSPVLRFRLVLPPPYRWAMFFIDDSNSTIQYSDAKSIPWNHKVPGIANNSADVTKCYDQTYTVNQNLCLTADSCQFQVPFTGSGITLFVIQSNNPLNTTLTLDGNISATATLVALPGPNDFAYNVTLYNVQGLHTAQHTLDVALVTYTPSGGSAIGSMIRFDSALINNTDSSVVSPSASGIGTTTAHPVPSSGGGSTGSSHSVIGPAVGGAVGGVVVIAAIILALLFCRRRKPPQHVAEFDPDPSIKNFPARPTSFDPQAVLYSSPLPSTAQSVQPLAYATSSRSSFPTTDINDRRSLQASSSGAPTSSTGSALIPRSSALRPSTAGSIEPQRFMVSNPEMGSISDVPMAYAKGQLKRVEAQSTGSSSAPIVSASLPPNIPGSGELTEEQASFVNNLRSLNVPAAEIASLLEVMRRERAESSGGRGASHATPTVDMGAPPSYDFKSPN
ncbi:hypothetical protein PILCRDRAFT_823037 [Piloderma croceum F 1598]|uniref:Uncharacterized protein n=1 Tax=Piloderma croceum (strain F 1598) TaxID=765440 RepID=A0A0C3B0T7_PILCF|nr:hypothetical protein PILCRDRAFT_823037 [Piloderma croceum F 1598]